MGDAAGAAYRRLSALVLVCAVAAGASPPLLAQAQNQAQAEAEAEAETETETEPSREPRGRRIEEVIVSARRVEESLQDTPISVAVFSQADLEKMGVSEIGDVARATPNLEMRKQNSREDNYAISIRGIGEGEVSLAIDPTVAVYLDGYYIARQNSMAFDVVDIKRIEVLRGPQGTLFGRNAVGGAINVVTEKPKGEFAFRQKFRGGNRDYRYSQTTVDTPRFGDFSAKLAFLALERDGEWESIYSGVTLGQKESVGARGAINWSPAETLNVDYTVNYSELEGNPQQNQLSAVRDAYSDPNAQFYGGPFFEAAEAHSSPDRQSKLPINTFSDDEAYSDVMFHGVTVEWEVSPQFLFKSLTSYRTWESTSEETDFGSFPAPADGSVCELDNYDFILGLCLQPVPAGTLVPFFNSHLTRKQRQRTQEFQFIGNALDGRIHYTTGLYYFEEQADSFYERPPQVTLSAPALVAGTGLELQNRGNSVTVFLTERDFETDNKSYAAYGEVTYTVIPDLDISVGMRYTVDEKKITMFNSLMDTPQSAAGSGVERTVRDDVRWTSFNPSLTVDYRWNPMISTYAKVVTGYRPGGYNIRANNVVSFKEEFDPEEVVNFELGWKTDLFDRRVRLNGALYYMDYKDQQISQFEAGSGGAASTIVNAGEATNSGIELEALWLPSDNLQIQAAYAYLKIDFQEFVTGVLDPATGMPAGGAENQDISDTASENIFSPSHSGSLAIDYRFAPRDWGTPSLRVGATYTGKIDFHPQLNVFDSSDAHTLVNARASLSEIRLGRDGTLELAVWGNNITNKEYRSFGIDFGLVGIATNNYGPLANWGVDIIYQYNR